MKHARSDYSRFQDPAIIFPQLLGEGATPIGQEEPVFLLRAKDTLFIAMLQEYIRLRWPIIVDGKELEATKQACDALNAHIILTRDWYKNNNVHHSDMHPVSPGISSARLCKVAANPNLLLQEWAFMRDKIRDMTSPESGKDWGYWRTQMKRFLEESVDTPAPVTVAGLNAQVEGYIVSNIATQQEQLAKMQEQLDENTQSSLSMGKEWRATCQLMEKVAKWNWSAGDRGLTLEEYDGRIERLEMLIKEHDGTSADFCRILHVRLENLDKNRAEYLVSVAESEKIYAQREARVTDLEIQINKADSDKERLRSDNLRLLEKNEHLGKKGQQLERELSLGIRPDEGLTPQATFERLSLLRNRVLRPEQGDTEEFARSLRDRIHTLERMVDVGVSSSNLLIDHEQQKIYSLQQEFATLRERLRVLENKPVDSQGY